MVKAAILLRVVEFGILIATKDPAVVPAIPFYEATDTTSRALMQDIAIDGLETQIFASDR